MRVYVGRVTPPVSQIVERGHDAAHRFYLLEGSVVVETKECADSARATKGRAASPSGRSVSMAIASSPLFSKDSAALSSHTQQTMTGPAPIYLSNVSEKPVYVCGYAFQSPQAAPLSKMLTGSVGCRYRSALP